jgi:hypothetical protein
LGWNVRFTRSSRDWKWAKSNNPTGVGSPASRAAPPASPPARASPGVDAPRITRAMVGAPAPGRRRARSPRRCRRPGHGVHAVWPAGGVMVGTLPRPPGYPQLWISVCVTFVRAATRQDRSAPYA